MITAMVVYWSIARAWGVDGGFNAARRVGRHTTTLGGAFRGGTYRWIEQPLLQRGTSEVVGLTKLSA